MILSRKCENMSAGGTRQGYNIIAVCDIVMFALVIFQYCDVLILWYCSIFSSVNI